MATSWTFVNNATTVTVTRTVDMFGGTVHSDTFICNKQLIKVDSTEPLLYFLYSNPDDLNYHVFDVAYTLVTSPVSTSAADLEAQVQAMLNSAASIIVFVITSADFTGSTYQDNRLIGKTSVTDFSIFTNEGTGALQKLNDGYTFDTVTGTLTMPAGNYQIEIYG